MKRVVVLEYKKPASITIFRSCTELVLNNRDRIGICLGALWNALNKGNGYYENKKCKIYYKNIERVKK